MPAPRAMTLELRPPSAPGGTAGRAPRPPPLAGRSLPSVIPLQNVHFRFRDTGAANRIEQEMRPEVVTRGNALAAVMGQAASDGAHSEGPSCIGENRALAHERAL